MEPLDGKVFKFYKLNELLRVQYGSLKIPLFGYCKMGISQKIRGCLAAASYQHGGFYKIDALVNSLVVIGRVGWKCIQAGIDSFFVRPCPLVPRHGFVDSRVLDGKDTLGLEMIYKEIEAAGEQIQLIISPIIDGLASSIVTDNSITIGPGNDGATAGKNSKSLLFQTGFDRMIKKYTNWSSFSYNLPPESSLYCEFVYGSLFPIPYIVQIREGPKTSGSVDFIPEDITVKEVISDAKLPEDLLAWESFIAESAVRPGLVFNHTSGSLASHYAVHCVVNNIPVVCSRRVQPGERLHKIVEEKKNYINIARNCRAALGLMQRPRHKESIKFHRGEDLLLGLASIHASSTANWNHSDTATMLFYGFLALIKTVAVLCAGEARHARSNADSGSDVALNKAGRAGRLFRKLSRGNGNGGSRNKVYKTIYDMGLSNWMMSLYFARYMFEMPIWSEGFGGKSWRLCTEAGIQALEDMVEFLDSPSSKTFNALLMSTNKLAALVHNNGRLYNKLVNDQEADAVAMYPGLAFLNIRTWRLMQHMQRYTHRGLRCFRAFKKAYVIAKTKCYQAISQQKAKAIVLKNNTCFKAQVDTVGLNNLSCTGGFLHIQTDIQHGSFWAALRPYITARSYGAVLDMQVCGFKYTALQPMKPDKNSLSSPGQNKHYLECTVVIPPQSSDANHVECKLSFFYDGSYVVIRGFLMPLTNN
jgi:hypothetical protein